MFYFLQPRLTREIPAEVRNAFIIGALTGTTFSRTYNIIDDLLGGKKRTFTKEGMLYWYRTFVQPSPVTACAASDLIEYLKLLAANNAGFFFKYTLNEDDSTLQTCLWQFDSQRREYGKYHYVMGYDNTYNVTRIKGYKLGMFTTENSDGRSIYTAFALMVVEDAENYSTVLRFFKESVSMYKDDMISWHLFWPSTIVADADPAFALAVAQEFPHANLKWCEWHFFRNLPKNLAAIAGKNFIY